jgi:Sulfotransferase family
VLSYLRKLLWDARRIRCEVEKHVFASASDRPPVFIVGCGRSGTTLLGKLLGRQVGIRNLNEPRDRWFVIDPKTDDIGLYQLGGQLDFEESDVTQQARTASGLISRPLGVSRRDVIVEKSPSNVFRLPWLRSLYPGCRIVNLIRNGRDVVTSIMRLVESNEYKIAAGPERNQWWGRDNCKRALILRRAARMGLLTSDPGNLSESEMNPTAAMLEWTMSIEAMDAFVAEHGWTGVLVVRYENIVDSPNDEMSRLLDFIGLDEKIESRGFANIIRSLETIEAAKFDLLIAHAHESAKQGFSRYMKLNGY